MLRTDLTNRAYIIACAAHTGQTDRGGNPYIQHALAVAEQMPDEITAAAALLHDILEDTAFTDEDLKAEPTCMPNEVIRIVRILTRDPSMTYMDYIGLVKTSPQATLVKIADLKNNMDVSRLHRELTDKDRSLLKRYEKALHLLEKS